MMEKLTFREDTQNILKRYAFDIMGKIKIFCPNCLCFRTESYIKKHFLDCVFIIKGEEIFDNHGIKIIKANNDIYLRRFIKKFDNLIPLCGGEIRRINWNKNYDYLILQRKNKSWGILPVGLAVLKYSSKMRCHVLFAIMMFPKCNQEKRLGTFFMDKIQNYYKKNMGLIIESPSNKIKKICDRFGLEYYYAP